MPKGQEQGGLEQSSDTMKGQGNLSKKTWKKSGLGMSAGGLFEENLVCLHTLPGTINAD